MPQRSLQKPTVEEARGARRAGSKGVCGAAFAVDPAVRIASCALTALAAALSGGHAHAAGDRDVEACIASSEHGQELRDDGKLIAARSEFLTCARATCPPLLQRDCASWLADVDTRIPSVVVGARDPSGHETADVRMSVDGAPRLDRLDGRALQLDPGEHLLRFERQGAAAVEQRVLLREGEKRREVAVRFAPVAAAPGDPPPGAPEQATSRPVPAVVLVLGGVGLAGGAAFAALAASAKGRADDLAATCAPRCAEANVDAVRLKLLVANAALGVGVAALGTAAVLFLMRPEQAAPPPSAGIGLVPIAGGGVAVLGGRF